MFWFSKRKARKLAEAKVNKFLNERTVEGNKLGIAWYSHYPVDAPGTLSDIEEQLDACVEEMSRLDKRREFLDFSVEILLRKRDELKGKIQKPRRRTIKEVQEILRGNGRRT